MGRHQHILGRGIGWGTSSEAGRRAASAYFTQEYPADPRMTRATQPRIEQRGGAERFVELKEVARLSEPRGLDADLARGSESRATTSDLQEFRNAVSGD